MTVLFDWLVGWLLTECPVNWPTSWPVWLFEPGIWSLYYIINYFIILWSEAPLRTLFKRRFTNTRFDWLIDYNGYMCSILYMSSETWEMHGSRFILRCLMQVLRHITTWHQETRAVVVPHCMTATSGTLCQLRHIQMALMLPPVALRLVTYSLSRSRYAL